MTIALYVDNTSEIVLSVLTDSSGSAISGAAVNATLYEADGTTTVTGQSWPVALSESAGEYVAQLPATLNVISGKIYYVNVIATYGGAKMDKTLTVRAEKRYQ